MLGILESEEEVVDVEDYIVVSRGYSGNISQEVMLWVKRGYRPLGGIMINSAGYHQAMVKYKKETE